MNLRFLVTLSVLVSTSTLSAQNFPQFRGTDGRGIGNQSSIPAEWDLEQSKAWEVAVEGAGWSQPVIWEDHVYVTTAVAENGYKPQDFAGGVRDPRSMGMPSKKKPDFDVEWKLVCLELSTGKPVWSTTVAKGKPKFDIHPSNSYATESPAANEQGVYVYFGAAGVVAGLSHDGKIKWKKNVGVFKTNNNFGTGSSLAIDTNKLFVQLLSEESADVMCLSTSNGETKWKQQRDKESTSWSTPVIWRNKVRKELVVSGGNQVDSFDPDSGQRLWSIRKVKAATACSICADDQQIYFGGSDPMSKGPLFAVKPGGKGTIEPKITNQKFETCSWRVPRGGPGMSTPVSNGKYVIVPDRSVAICYDATDGKVAFKDRLPNFSMVVACPTIVGQEVLMIDEKGKMGAVSMSDTFRFRKLGELNDVVWASPAVGGNRLLVRGVERLYCFRLGSKK